MHRLPNQYTVLRFRFAAVLLLVKWALIGGSAALLGCSLCLDNRDLTHLSIAVIGLAVPVTIAHWIVAARARCPLCIGLPLAHNACATHRNARRFFGSYRLWVALAAVLRGSFRCPYCDEPIAVEARPRHR